MWCVGVMLNRIVGFIGGFVCPYPEEERTLAFCMVCKVTRLTNQLDLVIKQNKVIIDVLMKIRDSLKGGVGASAENLHTGYFES